MTDNTTADQPTVRYSQWLASQEDCAQLRASNDRLRLKEIHLRRLVQERLDAASEDVQAFVRLRTVLDGADEATTAAQTAQDTLRAKVEEVARRAEESARFLSNTPCYTPESDPRVGVFAALAADLRAALAPASEAQR
jgi:hypothetical protein